MTDDKTTSHARRDLVRVLVVVAGFWGFAAHLELSETLAHWLQSYERFQLDEIPLTLWVLSMGLTWFAIQRTNEASELLIANQHLTQRVITAQEDERRLLAQELHDEVGQACTALRIEAAYIAKAIHTNPSAALEATHRIDQSSQRMHSLARDMLKRLRPPSLDSLGFEESLKELCKSWAQHCQAQCHTLIDVQQTHLADPLCTNLYRITQEALTNIAKHAHATQVWVSLNLHKDVLTLSITDNGQGLQHKHRNANGLGLIGMRERIASLRGKINFEDAQPGLRIHVQIPLGEKLS
jgi:glucose-6-phosphate-specific signal transduction histidine kinase